MVETKELNKGASSASTTKIPKIDINNWVKGKDTFFPYSFNQCMQSIRFYAVYIQIHNSTTIQKDLVNVTKPTSLGQKPLASFKVEHTYLPRYEKYFMAR